MRVYNWLPLGAFLAIYGLTCYLGVMLLEFGPEFVRHLYAYFSGVFVPVLSGQTLISFLILLHVPIVGLGIGYLIGLRFLNPTREHAANGNAAAVPFGAVLILLSLSIAGSIWSLMHAGAFHIAGAWLDYDRWIAARWHVFSTLDFFEFVNIYVFLQVLSALALVGALNRRMPLWKAALFVLPGILLTLFLFLKKQLVVYLLVVLLSYILHCVHAERLRRVLTKACFVIAFFYMVALFLPVLGIVVKGAPEQIARGGLNSQQILSAIAGRAGGNTSDKDFADKFFGSIKWRGFNALSSLYALNSIIFRTSAPALYYPIVFPDKHNYYGVDLPFDDFSPDDNRVIWDAMWPRTPGGSIMAPLQFSFYAQAGLWGAIGLSAIAGLLLGVLWRICLRGGFRNGVFAVGGALVIVFAIFLATDRARDSLASSYGMGWGIIPLMTIWIIQKHFAHRHHTFSLESQDHRGEQ